MRAARRAAVTSAETTAAVATPLGEQRSAGKAKKNQQENEP
jgi:hypothetical protein